MQNTVYKQHEQAIPFTSKTKLITLPIVFSLLMIIFIPVLMGYIAELLIPAPKGQMITVSSTVGMILTVISSVFVIMKISKIQLEDLGLNFTGAFAKIFTGTLCGLIAISLVALAINLLGGTATTYSFQSEYVTTLLIGVVFFAFQGTYEELMYRGYLMPHFSKAIGIFWSILISSVLFTMLHALNPGMTVMPVINLMLASIVFSLVYYKTGNLWLVGFAHGVWNFSQGFIYGSMVSGITLKGSVFKSLPIENTDLISGAS
ncbi:MAG: CPBP family intramembrane metalloprotease, partial [Flavobacteriaceae bacterium]|nr:CPBP family intramembrane metalloprotease [Flavobacteriaceae bacterium]